MNDLRQAAITAGGQQGEAAAITAAVKHFNQKLQVRFLAPPPYPQEPRLAPPPRSRPCPPSSPSNHRPNTRNRPLSTHRPNTATVESGLTLAVLYTAPQPVATPQPSRHTWGRWQFVSGSALEFYTSPPPLPPLPLPSPPAT